MNAANDHMFEGVIPSLHRKDTNHFGEIAGDRNGVNVCRDIGSAGVICCLCLRI